MGHPVNLKNLREQSAVILTIAALVVAWPDSAAAQSSAPRFELGGQVASTNSSQFDDTDVGVGARISWYPAGWLGAEAEINGYPGDFPGQRPFSRGRLEGLFGATLGATVRKRETIRKAAARLRDLPRIVGAVRLILIFPPPLACSLASGQTMFALDIGGGVEVYATPKTFVARGRR